MLEKITQAVEYIKPFLTETPEYAIVLGSGLGKLQDEVQDKVVVLYSFV